MELNGTRVIAADRATVWSHLTDPDTLREAIPGCQELEGSLEDGFTAVVKQKVGPVRATFKGGVTISDIVETESYRIAGEGKGGVAGFAKGRADVRLADVEEGTELSYDVHAEVGGKLAQLGSRLIHGTARRLADQFFDRFQEMVEGPPEDTDDAAGSTRAG
ncbi:carbon monoxide dehydrogenase subunit G [Rhodovulum iodosum]|uniref:Carbon monoxide dehydrogenase subunit G n=1 Tax=Rhodovulum iodosum TaxID=68291 RepID=A0ABV3XPZ9_9RHOB|nr:carbon monoxide dehydrogenase subunit G [Rhodovulum robiginosum]RSK31429.1 carbon monoxide dehydrogenase [Rhodovulum robiginosum]